MRVTVYVKLRQKESKLEPVDENSFKATVVAQPIENKANLEIISLLAAYYKIPKSQIKLVRGQKSKVKVLET